MNKFAKKVLMAGLLALMLAVSAFAVPSVADVADVATEQVPKQTVTLAETVSSGSCGTNLTWTLDDEGTLTISGEGEMTNWGSISDVPWYSSRSSIKKVVICDDVTSIGSMAFWQTSLTSVDIPDSVESIGDRAFYGCGSLKSITVDENNEYYSSDERGVLFNKDKTTLIQYPIANTATTYDIPDSVTRIGKYAFSGCHYLTSVEIGDSVVSIGDRAFYYCRTLTSIEIPDSVTSIGGCAFYYCTSLTSVEIPDSVTSIGEEAFYNTAYYNEEENWEDGVLYISNCLISAKASISGQYKIKEGTTLIADYAFYNCSSLTSVTIPDSVMSIGDFAFWKCTALTSVEIGDSVTSIGNYAFYKCTSLTSVSIGNSVTCIGSMAFWQTSLTSVHITDIAAWCGISFSIGSSNPLYYAKNLYLNDELVTELVIPEGVTSIGNYAFYSCTSLTSIEIPDSVTSIGDYAFSNCTSLTSVSIGDSVTSIGDYAFNYCSSLTSVDIPDSVESIGDCAFYCCTALTSVDIPDNVTSIGDMAFSDCYKLTSIDIPDSVESIGDDAFCRCGILTITVDENNGYYSSDERGVLFNKDKTTLILYPIRNTAIAYEIPDSVTSIGKSAFYWCTSLTSVEIGDSVTSIGEDAFYNCTSLTSVEIGDSVTSIEEDAFCYCRSLTSITVDENNEYYSSDERGVLFNKDKTTLIQYPAGNTATTYNISDSVTSIGIGAFMGCSSLTSVEIGDGATSIGNSAFSNCTSLKSIKIPAGVTSIGYWYSSPNITIYGYSGSYAETYANNKSIPFVALDATPITIPLPSKANDGNILYAEIDGVQTELTGESLEITPLKNMLVEIVEKESANSVFTVSTKYYFVNKETMTYTELSTLSSYIGNEDEASLRTNNPLSIRFKSFIMTASREEEAAFTVEEYGFIIGVKASLEAKGEELNFDASKYVSGVAYNRENGTDIVFDATDDEVYLFTGLLTNIPEKNYATEVVSKTYTKINVGGEVFTVYGEPVTASLYSVAKSLVSDGTELTEEQAAVVENIIKAVEYVDNN